MNLEPGYYRKSDPRSNGKEEGETRNLLAFKERDTSSEIIKAEWRIFQEGPQKGEENPQAVEVGYCYDCLNRVILRNIQGKIPHWVHVPHNCLLGEESEWHLRQKSLFPLDWIEKRFVKDEPGKRSYKIADIFNPINGKIMEFENRPGGRQIRKRDSFYQDIEYTADWVNRSSRTKVLQDLKIVEASYKFLRGKYNFDRFETPIEHYLPHKDLRFNKQFVCFMGDLPIQDFIEIDGKGYLLVNEAGVLEIAIDKKKGIERPQVKKEWVFGRILTTGQFLGRFRPQYRDEAEGKGIQGNDPTVQTSAKRILDYTQKAGEKILRESSRSSTLPPIFQYFKVETDEEKGINIPYDKEKRGWHTPKSPEDLSKEEILLSYQAGNRGHLQHFLEYLSKLNAEERKKKWKELMEAEGLYRYSKLSHEVRDIDQEEMKKIYDPEKDKFWNNGPGIDKAQEEKIFTEIFDRAEQMKRDQIRRQKDEELYRRIERKKKEYEEEIPKTLENEPIHLYDNELNIWIGKKVSGVFGQGTVVEIIDGGYLKIELEKSGQEEGSFQPVRLVNPNRVRLINN